MLFDLRFQEMTQEVSLNYAVRVLVIKNNRHYGRCYAKAWLLVQIC